MDDDRAANDSAQAHDFDALAPTLDKSFFVTVRDWNFGTEEDARHFGERIMDWTRLFSKSLDLSRLERVIVAGDYRAALADVRSGSAHLPAPDPTANEYGEGKAMSLPVVRDGELWSVVVMWTPILLPLNDHGEKAQSAALQPFLHELIHVDDLQFFARTYPGGWTAAKPRGDRDAKLQRIALRCESEYSAQRRSAWLWPEHGLAFLEMLDGAMKEIDSQLIEARRAYRLHGDMAAYWSIVAARATFLFQTIGYALGHGDWLAWKAAEHPELAARYEQGLREASQLPTGWLIDACRRAVQPIYTLEKWEGLEVCDPLIAVLEQFLNQYGMYTRETEAGMYVDMPYTGFHDL